jgi:cytidine deaminase
MSRPPSSASISSSIASASKDVQELFGKALQTRENSHSPYSKCKVGAAIKTSDGNIYSGCNVENASYGGSICAERSAIVKAVSDQGVVKIKEVMVVTDATPPWPPCGMCRQVMAEFGTETVIYLANLKGDLNIMTFQEIFPQAFTGAQLPPK